MNTLNNNYITNDVLRAEAGEHINAVIPIEPNKDIVIMCWESYHNNKSVYVTNGYITVPCQVVGSSVVGSKHHLTLRKL